MASFFLTLGDGRCLARYWAAWDELIKAVAHELGDSTEEEGLRDWLLRLVPGPEDVQHIGYGPWVRITDEEIVPRKLDLRDLSPTNRRLFTQAALKAADRCAGDQTLMDLADMIRRAENREPPLSRTDLRCVVPHKGRIRGPGVTEDSIYPDSE
jgi:hypothetical protein